MSEPPDLETLARRYLDLWQDQVSALAADPEFTETLGRMLQVSAALGPAGWMSVWTAAAAGLKPQNAHDERSAKSATTPANPAPGSAAAAAPSHDGGDDLAELRRRLAALEARLAGLDGARGAARNGKRRRLDVADAGAVAENSAGAGRGASPRSRNRRS